MPPELLESLRETIQEFGLEAHADAILARVKPAVRLGLGARSSLELGESRIGGVPDLPVGMAWPRNTSGEALTFILQLRLADVPPFSGNPFPETGMLYFFIGLDEPAWDVEHRVILNDATNLERAMSPAEDEFANDTHNDLAPHRLTMDLFADVPRWATSDYDALIEDMTDDEADALSDLGSRESDEVAQLLGHVATIGHDTREDAFVVREVNAKFLFDYQERAKLDMTRAQGWHNLLRVYSSLELELNIWDAGFFNVLVREDDLERLNFENLYVAVETS
jgi:uncharacterized protein YwqG